MSFIPIDPMNVRTKFEVHSFTRSWENQNHGAVLRRRPHDCRVVRGSISSTQTQPNPSQTHGSTQPMDNSAWL